MGQSAQLNGVDWSASYSCRSCGTIIEFDDCMPAPKEVREALIKGGGKWHLVLSAAKPHKLKAAQVLASLFQLSAPDALKQVNRVIELGGVEGTKEEMTWFANKLSQKGVESSKNEITEATSSFMDFMEFMAFLEL